MALVLLTLCLLLVTSTTAGSLTTESLTTEILTTGSLTIGSITTDPPTDCNNANAGDKIPDPYNCLNFFMCIGDGEMIPDSIPCGEEYYCFSSTDLQCSDDEAACKEECKADPPVCRDECDGPGTLVYNKYDCHIFSICEDNFGNKLDIDCLDTDKGPYFNGHTCVQDSSACCNCKLEKCENAGDLIPDPEHCKNYYACLDLDGTGSYTIEGPYTCSDNGIFNETIRHCNPEITECEDTCIAVIDTFNTSTMNTPGIITTGDGCLNFDDYTCPPGEGYQYYPLCTSSCDKDFILCDSTGFAREGECENGDVFPIDGSQYCVRPEDCDITNTMTTAEVYTTNIMTTADITTIDDGCWNFDDYTCPPGEGYQYYPLCPTSCDKRFIVCDSTGFARYGECENGDVFPIDGSQYCVRPEDCVVVPFYIHI